MIRRSITVAVACTLGCASAEDPAGGPSPTSAGVGMSSATSDPGPMTTGIDPPDDDSAGTDGGDGGSSGSTGADESTGTQSTGGESSSGGESSGGVTTFPCDAPTTCNSSETIGGVSGDTPSPPVTEMGSEPIWVQIEVAENDSNVIGNDLEVTVSLQSQGADWDLRAFLGDPGDSNGCGGQEKRSETAGVDSVSYSWGEGGGLANNTDDGTFVAVEIFPKDGVCTEGSSWTLTVTGAG